MTSEQSFNNNTSEAGGVLLEIWEPDLIVLPMPEKNPLANASFRLWLGLTNNTLKAWFFNGDRLITPELVAADGQVFKRTLMAKAQYVYKENLARKIVGFISKKIDYLRKKDASWVHPKKAKYISIIALICWYKDSLQPPGLSALNLLILPGGVYPSPFPPTGKIRMSKSGIIIY